MLKALAETTDDPREALLLFIQAHSPVTEADCIASHNAEPKRVRKYLADLTHDGCIARNQANAYVFLGWHRIQRRRFPTWLQKTVTFPDDLTNARAPVPSAPAGASASGVSIESNSSRIDPDPSISTRLDSRSSFGGKEAEPESGGSARSYITEKLCVPKLQRLRIEVTGGNVHMARKFSAMLLRDADQLAEWIGEAATPAIEQPCQFLNVRMTEYLRTNL